MKEFILYVGRSATDRSLPCPGSAVAGMLAEKLKHAVDVQDVEALGALPEWLDGTPVLVDRGTRYAYKGSDCLLQLQSIAAQREKQTTQAKKEVSKSPSTGGDEEELMGIGAGRGFEQERFVFEEEQGGKESSERGSETQRLSEKKVTDTALEDYIRIREQSQNSSSNQGGRDRPSQQTWMG